MVVNVIFSVAPNTVQYGDRVVFSGHVDDDGVPEIGQGCEIYHVASGARMDTVYTDDLGNFTMEWYPDQSWIGSHEFQLFVVLYEGYWSTPDSLTVTNGVPPPPPPISLLWVAGIAAVGLYLFGAFKKKGE